MRLKKICFPGIPEHDWQDISITTLSPGIESPLGNPINTVLKPEKGTFGFTY